MASNPWPFAGPLVYFNLHSYRQYKQGTMAKNKSAGTSAKTSADHAHDALAEGADAHLAPDDAASQVSPGGIYLISPSGAISKPDDLQRACKRLKRLGFKTTVDRSALAIHERFAGTDRQRLAAINRALTQKHPVVMATRGGYGLSRLLPHIDWDAVAQSGKQFVGLSDFTLFNLALLAKTGTHSFSGPMAVGDFGGKKMDDLTADLFVEALSGQLEILSFESSDSDRVDARGVLWGGNLAMVASLVGTPIMPDIDGGILFLEDIAEHPYRVERMLAQLWQAGILARQKAIVLGHFNGYTLGSPDNGFDMPSVIKWLRATVKVPVVTGLPYGHVKVKATLPVGKVVGIATEKGFAHLVLDEHEH